MSVMSLQANPITMKLYGDGKRLQAEQIRMENAPLFIIHPHSNFKVGVKNEKSEKKFSF